MTSGAARDTLSESQLMGGKGHCGPVPTDPRTLRLRTAESSNWSGLSLVRVVWRGEVPSRQPGLWL
ncbi:hypothetical protein ADK64_39635 [Streptomyces sp. MMG1121]|nr:hypothetical protein ADK64_39635 [Streptomyces sp. MMG1121]